MEKQMIKSAGVTDEKNETFILNYYLISRNGFYGVYVEKLSEEGIFIEGESAPAVGCRRNQMIDLLLTLAENTVTPITLCEVLDDLHDKAMEKSSREKGEIA